MLLTINLIGILQREQVLDELDLDTARLMADPSSIHVSLRESGSDDRKIEGALHVESF
jgi:hypothetical protein